MLWIGSLCGRNAGIAVQEGDQWTWNCLQFGNRLFDVLGPRRRIKDGVHDLEVDANGFPEAIDALEIREVSPNFLVEAKRLFFVSNYQLHLPAVSQVGNLKDPGTLVNLCEMNQTTPLHSISAVTIPKTSHG